MGKAEELQKLAKDGNYFKLLWDMYDELIEDRENYHSGGSGAGTIISRYAHILESTKEPSNEE